MGGSNLGMGLTYTKKVINALRGEIDIKCKKSIYTAIQVVLPMARHKKTYTSVDIASDIKSTENEV